MNFRGLAQRAKQIVDRRGGPEALKEDAQELREVVRRPGSGRDKAKAAAEVLREPGAAGADRSASDKPPKGASAGDS